MNQSIQSQYKQQIAELNNDPLLLPGLEMYIRKIIFRDWIDSTTFFSSTSIDQFF
jgi:hypothetical protein